MAPTSMPYVVEIVALPKLSDNLMSCPPCRFWVPLYAAP